MKLKLVICFLFVLTLLKETKSQGKFEAKNTLASINYVQSLKDTLNLISEKSDNEFFKMHCNSMLAVLNSKVNYASADSAFLLATYNAFNNPADTSNAKELSSYLKRQRPFILSWVSPTDGAVSFSRLKPPRDWDPQKEYPVYIQLHGLTSPANSIIEYVTKPFRDNPSSTFSFEDGYLLSPWGRGNLWYQGISETDIWECLAALEDIVSIDPSRKYISGHSMGGYGAWSIASKSPNTWAALGVHAGALWYSPNLVNADVAYTLRDLPTYFVCGTSDGLLGINQTSYGLLEDAGNENIEFVTFPGGHEYLEKNVENMYLWMRDFENDNITNIINTADISQQEQLIKIYPNPVKTSANILFTVPEISDVNLSVYDLYGRKIKELVNEAKIPGDYELMFDASDLTSGIYMVQMKTKNCASELKMAVVK